VTTGIQTSPTAPRRTSLLRRAAAGVPLTMTALLVVMTPWLATAALAATNVVSSIGVGFDPLGVAVNTTTNRIYVANANSASVSVIDGATDGVVGTISLAPGSAPFGVAVNPATNRNYTANLAANTLSVIRGQNNRVIADVPLGGAPFGVAVNPRTNRVYATSQSTNSLQIIQDN
jgi:YVTN family beta-propeller protein